MIAEDTPENNAPWSDPDEARKRAGLARGPRPTPPVQTARKKRLKRAKLARKPNR